GLFLAGAWTATGWPATMESAVRSGTAAAREALNELGFPQGQLPQEAA
ncbi:FAD-dependent oxidoreductase, partial [Streptomyces nigrescens]